MGQSRGSFITAKKDYSRRRRVFERVSCGKVRVFLYVEGSRRDLHFLENFRRQKNVVFQTKTVPEWRVLANLRITGFSVGSERSQEASQIAFGMAK